MDKIMAKIKIEGMLPYTQFLPCKGCLKIASWQRYYYFLNFIIYTKSLVTMGLNWSENWWFGGGIGYLSVHPMSMSYYAMSLYTNINK